MVALVVGVIAASCGGSSDDAEPSGGDATTTSVASGGSATTTAADGGGTTTTAAPSSGAGKSIGTVTIDGVDYVFGDNGPAATCDPDFFGGFFAVLYSEDLTGNFSVELWNEGTGDGNQVPSAQMKVEANGETLDLDAIPDKSWPAAEAGSSYIDSFVYEGNTASGTIYFINSEVAYNADLAPLDPIVADFTVTCADG
jgi:hypothetical protein